MDAACDFVHRLLRDLARIAPVWNGPADRPCFYVHFCPDFLTPHPESCGRVCETAPAVPLSRWAPGRSLNQTVMSDGAAQMIEASSIERNPLIRFPSHSARCCCGKKRYWVGSLGVRIAAGPSLSNISIRRPENFLPPFQVERHAAHCALRHPRLSTYLMRAATQV